MYVGDSIPKEIIDKYVTEAPKLSNLFGGEVPKICGTHTFMRHPVAASRIQTMTQVFNFFFNESTRNFGNPSLQCKTSNETEQGIVKSKMFEYNDTDISFAKENGTVTEKEGFVKMTLTRTKVGQTGIAFVQTELMTADRQSQYREVVRRAISLEQKSGFWQSAPALGSTESTCCVLPNGRILCLDNQIMIFHYSVLANSKFMLFVSFATRD